MLNLINPLNWGFLGVRQKKVKRLTFNNYMRINKMLTEHLALDFLLLVCGMIGVACVFIPCFMAENDRINKLFDEEDKK
tara:strand:- start:5812 stop:6048 length:237 start_codon:yes stop_codon:yes gene_type:complete